MMRRCPGRVKPCMPNPNHLQVLAVRAAALAQLERTEEAAKAAEVLLGNFPGLTVERHLKNFRWKMAADTAHYRDGLLKAGVPLSKSDAGRVLQAFGLGRFRAQWIPI